MSLQFNEPLCYITTLVTDSEVRGEGFGKLLLAETERWARERRCNRITVTSANYRTAAHAFYEAHGYEQTGRRLVKLLRKAD
jgi:GNAT superfamily N-acetyltransferase